MRSRSDDINDYLRVFCKAQPSVHISQKDEIKSDDVRGNSGSKKAYAVDAKALIRRSASNGCVANFLKELAELTSCPARCIRMVVDTICDGMKHL